MSSRAAAPRSRSLDPVRRLLPRRRRALAAATAGVVALSGGALVVSTGGAADAASSRNCALGSTFGRMFPQLKGASWSTSDLAALSERMIETTHFKPSTAPADTMHNYPSGYTYTGQFVDHDITLDLSRELGGTVDPRTLQNFRTPQLDLDSVYIKGPSGSPEAYEADGMHFRLGAPLSGAQSDRGATDLLRDAKGQAVIGDPRNDENRITASLASIVTRFHNAVVDDLRRAHPTWTAAQTFAAARQQVTWYYQWAVLTDYLPTTVGTAALYPVVHRSAGRWVTGLKYYNPCNGAMPVEFSGAAFRYGHSIVRTEYRINEDHPSVDVFRADGDPTRSLGGGTPSPSDFAVDWKYFFPLTKDATPQNAYQLDASLQPNLRLLPAVVFGSTSTNLATRNLLRGQRFGEPTGQDVARAMGLTPLPDDKILVGPAVGKGSPQAVPITAVSRAFAGKAPLWTYILSEAAATNATIRGGRVVSDSSAHPHLGPVGGRIVAETIVGLLKADKNSVLNHPEFTPSRRYSRTAGTFTVADIVRIGTGLGPVGLDTAALDRTGRLSFGAAAVSRSVDRTVTVRNASAAAVSVAWPWQWPTGNGFGAVEVLPTTTCGGKVLALAPGATCTVALQMTPKAPGETTARFIVQHSGPNGWLELDLVGSAG